MSAQVRFEYKRRGMIAVPGRLAGRGPHSSGIRCEATTVIKMSQMVSVDIFPKCGRLEGFYISAVLVESLICRLYLLAEHYSSVQKKTAMQKNCSAKVMNTSLRSIFWFSRNPHQRFYNSWCSHFRDFQHTRIYYMISNIHTEIPYMYTYRDSLRISSILGFPIGIY